MPLFLLPKDVPNVILAFGDGTPDLLKSETHHSTIVLTDHPVERGSKVTDHLRAENRAFSFEVTVTNTPITRDEFNGRGDMTSLSIEFPTYKPPFDGTPGAIFRKAKELGGAAVASILGNQTPIPKEIQVLAFPTVFNRIREISDQLFAFQQVGQEFTVVTSQATYEGMLILDFGNTKDQPGSSDFKVDMRVLRTVETATVKAPKPLEKRAAPKDSKGSQATKPKDAAKSTSLILKAVQAITGG